MKKRQLSSMLLAIVMVLVILAGCSKSNSNSNGTESASPSGSKASETASDSPSASASEAPKEEKTIVFSTIQNYYTDGLKKAAEDYNKLHPETKVKIDIVVDNPTYTASFQAKMAAGGDDAPDIVHANLLGDSPGNNIKKNFILPLNDYVKEPNPYNNGTSLWDGVDGAYWPYAYSDAGDIFMVPFDLVGTGFYYNKDLFAKAGITEAPTTWEDMFASFQKLKDSGVIPLALTQVPGQDTTGWMIGAFTDWAARSLLPEVFVQPGDARNTPDVEAINSKVKYAADNPFFDIGAVEDPERRMALWKSGKYDMQGAAEKKYWSTLKELSKYLQPGYATMSDADSYKLFIAGKAAAYWNGSWQVGTILKDQKSLKDKAFAWGTFKFPDFKTPDPNFPDHPRGILVPGHQIAITNKMKNDEDKVARAKDFVKFLFSPAEAQVVYTTTIEAGQFVQGPSLVKGVTLSDEVNSYLTGFITAGNMNQGIGQIANGNPKGEANLNSEMKALQLQYYNDKISLEEFLKKKAAFTTKTNENYIAENKWDLDPKTNP
ncbi:ABC transporter substrate-binding protein [Cohnella silvisoli]|uniref:Extracellular solute-binding protein n=1 Tax=Cohnella silvisoli TaxID=2873699 RepID=A0ABV1KTA9_9BACL|nr:extracellular solute-binding protein [Cohnella silvisoli]MCD9022918.1 extracellular solute-binding protein [Cohnella silvisoli]